MHNPNIIDIEASGFGGESYPIEIGLVLGDGKKYCSLILPLAGWKHWNKDAEKIHHISRQMLQKHGTPAAEVAVQLNQILEGLTLYSDGWVVDKPWLTTLFCASGIEMKFSVSPIEIILSEAQMNVWHKTKEQIIIQQNIQRHRASNDAWIIQETFRQTNELTKNISVSC